MFKKCFGKIKMDDINLLNKYFEAINRFELSFVNSINHLFEIISYSVLLK